MSKNKKICSFIYPGRNDSYNPHFLHRLNYVLEFTAKNINELGLNHFFDLAVIDWGSDKKFRNELQLSHNGVELVKFYEISKEITLKEVVPKNFFHLTKIINAGIRNIDSKYILIASHDVIMSKVSILNLYNLLKNSTINQKLLENSFFQIQRFFLPNDLFDETPSFNYLSRWMNRSGFLLGDMGGTIGGGVAATLASNNTWNSLAGFNEKFRGYGYSDTDLHSRVNMIMPYFDSFRFGICMHKIPRGISLVRQNSIFNKNPSWTSFEHKVNDNNWGMANYGIPYLISNKINHNFNEKDLKLISRKKDYNIITILFSIFLVPVNLRILYISFIELILFKYIQLLISPGHVRSIIFFGYRDAYGPLLIAKTKKSIEIFILDNIKKFAEKLHRSNPNKTFNESSIGIIGKRLFLVGGAVLRDVSSLIDHQGYFRPINCIEKIQIDNVFNDMPQVRFSNILFFRYNEIKHIDIKFIKNKIKDYSNKIFAMVFFDFEKNNEILYDFNDFTSIKIPNSRIKILINNNYKSDLSTLKKSLYKYRLYNFLILFVLTNIILINCNLIRITFSLFKRIISLIGLKYNKVN